MKPNIMTASKRPLTPEQRIQSKKIKDLEAEGYYVIKLIQTNKNGIPDIIAIPPNSDVLFVEVKRKDGTVSPLQKFRHKELEKYGIRIQIFSGE
jgi:Holliday junction resolvase